MPLAADEMEELYHLRQRLVDDIHLELMYLLVTDACNFRCRYCFENTPVAPSFRPSMMTRETVEQALQRFADWTNLYGRPGAKRVVHLYGGEPLLNRSAVYHAVVTLARLKESGRMPNECEMVIITNGSRLTEEDVTLFARHHVSVGISLDGPREINNAYRVGTHSQLDAFALTREAYERARRHGLRVGLSVTVTPDVVKHFDEVLDFFLNDLGVQDGVNFNILHYHPAVPTDSTYYERAAQCLLKAFERFRVLGIYEERVMRKVKAFVRREPMYADCGVVGNQIVVSPDGRIGVCQDFVKPRTYFSGNVFDSTYDPIRSRLFDEWQMRSPLNMEQCLDCVALGMCGGGCPACAELQTGNRWNVDQRICPHSQLMVKWLIWQSYTYALGRTS
ncbi:MAG: radical SAM protein [Patescibacteria group bacterium]